MRSRLPLSALSAFEAAARLGAFRDAAAELHLTPSAISHAVRGLERSLGAPLFVRDRGAMRLTPQGEALLRHVARGFAELRRGVEAVSASGPQVLRLHCAPSFAAKWLSPRLGRFLAAAPGIEVKLSASTAYPRFPSEEFDAGILYGEARQSGLANLSLGQERVAPLCAPALAATLRQPADLLQHAPLIESEHKRLRWPDWFAANGLTPPAPQGLRFDRSFLAIAAAADGLGVALESTLLAQAELQAGRLVMPVAASARDLFYAGHQLVFPLQEQRYAPLRRFIAWLSAELDLPDPAASQPA